jgi:hypothetical protein
LRKWLEIKVRKIAGCEESNFTLEMRSFSLALPEVGTFSFAHFLVVLPCAEAFVGVAAGTHGSAIGRVRFPLKAVQILAPDLFVDGFCIGLLTSALSSTGPRVFGMQQKQNSRVRWSAVVRKSRHGEVYKWCAAEITKKSRVYPAMPIAATDAHTPPLLPTQPNIRSISRK